MITTILVTTGIIAIVFTVGYAVGKHHNSSTTDEYLATLATQTKDKVIYDIKGELHGIKEAVDENRNVTLDTRKSMFEITDCLIKATELKTKDIYNKQYGICPSQATEVNWDSFMDDDEPTEPVTPIEKLNPMPWKYHNQSNVRLSSQSLEGLRNQIDKLWQKAYSNEKIVDDKEAYDNLAKIHRTLSAVVEKIKLGKNY